MEQYRLHDHGSGRASTDAGLEMRVLIAPDKFKGTLTALEVATAIAQGLAATGVISKLLRLADGWDGSVTAALHAGFTSRPVAVRGADGHRHGRTGVIDVRAANQAVGFWRRRTKPSCATDATSAPSRRNISPRLKLREPEAEGLSCT